MSYCIGKNDIKNYLIPDTKIMNYTFPKKQGCMQFDKILAGKHLLFRTRYNSNNNICVEYEDYACDCLFLTIILDGKIGYGAKKSKDVISFEASQTGLIKISDTSGLGYLTKNIVSKSLGIVIDKNLAYEFLNGYKQKNNFDILKYTKLNPKTLNLAKEIYYCSIDGSLGDIYLQSKVLELIYLELLPLKNPKKNDVVNFSIYDKKALDKAVEVLRYSFQNPPSIYELSKIVHLNEFKLKYGFKKYYGTSIYKVILSHRLNEAKSLLLKEDFNISKVATMVGYKHVQSFSNAFYKYHGLRPKDIKKI